MAVFYNQASLSYSGGNTNSNIVAGEMLEVLSVTKTAVENGYSSGETLTYIVSIINSGTVDVNNVTVTDNLGLYTDECGTFTPLSYVNDSVKYYLNGSLLTAPSVDTNTELTFSGITVPASGNAIIIYSAVVNSTAPLAANSCITNSVTVESDCNCAANSESASASVCTRDEPILTISKSLCPSTLTENCNLTYTFTIQNLGNTEASSNDNVVITDVFNPTLRDISVSIDGTVVSENTEYTYNGNTGEFATVAGIVKVPAATYSRNCTNGEWTVNPGVTTVTIKGVLCRGAEN